MTFATVYNFIMSLQDFRHNRSYNILKINNGGWQNMNDEIKERALPHAGRDGFCYDL